MTAPHSALRALILFAHGARDARWAEPLLRIQKLVAQRVDSAVQVQVAFLELMSPSLPDMVSQLVAAHVEAICIVPIFLGQGGHVRNDLPALVHQLELTYPLVEISLASAIGENELVLNAIADACVAAL